MADSLPTGMNGGIADLLQAGVDRLQPLFPIAPPTYKYRLIAQFAFCSYLATTSLVYLALYVYHSRKSNRGIWILRFSASSEGDSVLKGRLITINSILLFVILAALASAGLMVNCWCNWRFYVVHTMTYREDYVLTKFIPWIVIFIQAYAFSFTNLYATLTARKRLKGLGGTGHNAWIYNSLLIAFPIVILGSIIPIFIIVNNIYNKVFPGLAKIYDVLRTALANLQSGKPIDFSVLSSLQTEYPALAADGARATLFLKSICALCMVYGSIIVLMNVYSLSLVLTLRKHVSTLRQMASSSAQMDGISSITGAATVHSGPKPRWSLQKSAMLGTTSKQDIALHRLTSDLTYSVPLTIILLLGLMTCTICIMAYDFVAPSWAVSEYTQDGFTWMYLGVTDIVMTVFLTNLIRAWRSEEHLHNVATTSRKQHSGATSVSTPRFIIGLPTVHEEKIITIDERTPEDLAFIEQLEKPC